MSAADWLIRGTAWAALTLYVAGEWMVPQRRRPARWLHTLGWGALLAHILGAFHFQHGWSQTAALAETARQTRQLTGLDWGGGLFVNYFFALVWTLDVLRAWTVEHAGPHRASRLDWAVRGFFLFMIINGAVVFVDGPARWLGLVLCLVLLGGWARRVPK